MTASLGEKNEVYIASMATDMQWLRRRLKPRRCRDVISIANVDSDPEAFIAAIARIVAHYGIAAILPYSDQVSAPCVRFADQLGATLPLPAYETFVRALDKWETLMLARSVSLPAPRSISSEDPDIIRKWLADRRIDYPIIVKPRIRGGKGGVRLVRSSAELKTTLEAFCAIGAEVPYFNYRMPLVQEYVRGSLHDCAVLYNRGEIRASFTKRQLRGAQPHGGPSAVAVSTNEPKLKKLTKTLMDALGWHGPAQVEWVRDESTGGYKLLEINPRFWGTTGLAIAAGMDFPALTVAMLRDGDVAPQFAYRYGVTIRFAVPYELCSIVKREPRKMRALLRYASPLDLFSPDVVFSWRWSDPAPHLFRLCRMAAACRA